MEQSQQVQTLTIKHLAKNYNKRWVVKDVSFSMQSGQIVGLLGPNGAGKTTSFYMVVGLVRMDKGEIYLMIWIFPTWPCMSGHVKGLAICRRKLQSSGS